MKNRLMIIAGHRTKIGKDTDYIVKLPGTVVRGKPELKTETGSWLRAGGGVSQGKPWPWLMASQDQGKARPEKGKPGQERNKPRPQRGNPRQEGQAKGEGKPREKASQRREQWQDKRCRFWSCHGSVLASSKTSATPPYPPRVLGTGRYGG